MPEQLAPQREVVIAMVEIAILMLLVVLDLCVVAGCTADSRDSEYRLWPLAAKPALNPIAVAATRATRRAS
ncbi:MAG: hypothetical protein ACRDVG_10660 [Jatrophihabitantaceae bacterium]